MNEIKTLHVKINDKFDICFTLEIKKII